MFVKSVLVRLLFALTCCSLSSAFESVPLFQAYTGYPPCFRQPVVVVAPPATILVFAEGRNNSFCSGTIDGNIKYAVLRRSTDGGATWLPMQTLYPSPGLDYLVALFDPLLSTVFLLLQVNTSITILLTSSDLGATWSQPTPLSYKQPFKLSYPAVGHGLVVDGALCPEPTCQGQAGRLIAPFVCHNGTTASTSKIGCPGCFSCVLYTDDRGQSWQIGATSDQDGTREACLVQLQSKAKGTAGAAVLAVERNMGATPGIKEFALSLDGGQTVAVEGLLKTIPDPVTANWTGVVSGCSRFDTSSRSSVVVVSPLVSNARADLGVFTSTDEGVTWAAGQRLYSGPAGYSDALQWNETHLAVAFENGIKEFAQQISFGFVVAANQAP